MEKYNPRKIEQKWQKIWQKSGIYKAKDSVKGKNNFYHLVMFPYPSGDLHIGHWYNFAQADVFARFKKMQGFNVMSPIGFDSFGLPAENAAIKRKISSHCGRSVLSTYASLNQNGVLIGYSPMGSPI